jgi:uncharacterized protein YjdB
VAAQTPTAAAVRFVEGDTAAAFRVEDPPRTLHAEILRADGTVLTGALTWRSADRRVARVDETGAVRPVGVGRTTVTARAAGGASAECVVTVYKRDATSVRMLSRGPISMERGKTFLAVLRYTPMRGYTPAHWSTSDPTVATVDAYSGRITAVGKGTAVITAEATALEGVAPTLRVEVSVPVTAIAIYREDGAHEARWLTAVGAVHMLYAVTEPPLDEASGEVLWTSSAPQVVSVDKHTGELTARRAGEATITARATSGKKAVCVVQVALPTESIAVPESELRMEPGETRTLHPVATPAANVAGLTWSSSDPSVATVSAVGEVIAVAPGAAKITAVTVDGLSVDCAVTVL